MPKNQIFKELTFKKKFKTYHEFHNENREEIYKSIIDLFSEFQNVKNKTLAVAIKANIENIEWSTELNFSRGETHVLKKDIMPFFEDNEDYETCHQIISLTKSLT